MISPFLFALQSIILKIFSTKLLPICIRVLLLFCIIFFILPIFIADLSSSLIKLQLFILCVILCELLAYKIQQGLISNYLDTEKSSKNKKTKIISTSINQVANNTNLTLFLHTNSTCIEKFIPESSYTQILLEDFSDAGVKLYDHHSKPILCVEIETCSKIIKNLSVYPLMRKLFSSIKKNAWHFI